MNLQEAKHFPHKTFAIISHPDAGKTTLTEKFLLFGGAIQEAGAVKSNKIKKTTSSDFMELERQRGISISTSVLRFKYKDTIVNLLDTPGHKDFAEDTFRTLSAVDSAIVVIDSVKGVEPQTIRLMEVCSMRKIPIMVFINKIDRNGKDPYDVLEEVEKILHLKIVPFTWPINTGNELRGIFYKFKNTLKFVDNEIIIKREDAEKYPKNIQNKDIEKLAEDNDLLDMYGTFQVEEFLAGNLAPVFFGSALNNFGIVELLDFFVENAPTPYKKESSIGDIYAKGKKFSGFVFKIHANIDPKHRDRIAFLRVCSGIFERSKDYHHVRLNKRVRFNNPYSFFGQSKNVINFAYPGDVIGLYDTGTFKIGDTITEGENFHFLGIPTFSPEVFKELSNANPMKTKQLEKGVKQLTDEGVAQFFVQPHNNKKIIGCVGELQFEVIQYRLLQEYGASCSFTPLPYFKASWLKAKDKDIIQKFVRFKADNVAYDKDKNYVYLSPSEWYLNTERNNNPDIQFLDMNEIVSH